MNIIIAFIILFGALACAQYVDPDVVQYEKYLQFTRAVERIPLNSISSSRSFFVDAHGFSIYFDQLASNSNCGTDPNNTIADMQRAITAALPNLAWQYGFNTSEAQNFMGRTSDLTSIVVASLSRQDYNAVATRTRGFFDIFVDIGCGAFSSFALPGFLLLRDTMYWYHTVGKPTSLLSTEQKFFVQAAHGPIVTQEAVKFYYNAGVISLLGGSVLGITFSHNVYVYGPQISSSSSGIPFFDQVGILIHELQHVKQYKSLGYVSAAFGASYLFNYCTRGFVYSDIDQEVEARNKASQVMSQLRTKFPQFFDTWKARNLVGALGFPLDTNVDQDENGAIRLSFDKGVLEIKGLCFRILPANYYSVKGAAKCTITPFKPPAGLCQKYPDSPACDPDVKAQQNAKCQANKNLWNQMLSSLPSFTC